MLLDLSGDMADLELTKERVESYCVEEDRDP